MVREIKEEIEERNYKLEPTEYLNWYEIIPTGQQELIYNGVICYVNLNKNILIQVEGGRGTDGDQFEVHTNEIRPFFDGEADPIEVGISTTERARQIIHKEVSELGP